MEPEQRANVSVIDPIHPSIEWVKRVLFHPFEIERWFVIGFCAWLATLGSKGGGFNGNIGNPNSLFNNAEIRNTISENLYWIIPTAIAVLVVGIVLALLVVWLSSRGRFMFLHCLRHNVAEVKRPWRMYAELSYSLFLFRVVLYIIGLVVLITIIGIGAAVGVSLAGAISSLMVLAMILIVTVGIIAFIGFAIVSKLTNDFIVPLMMIHRLRCTHAWQMLWELISNRMGAFILYLLFQILIHIVIGTLTLFLVLMTCGIACCFLFIPYIGTVLLLPILVFQRSYAFMYLRQFGPNFDLFYQESEDDVHLNAETQVYIEQETPAEEPKDLDGAPPHDETTDPQENA